MAHDDALGKSCPVNLLGQSGHFQRPLHGLLLTLLQLDAGGQAEMSRARHQRMVGQALQLPLPGRQDAAHVAQDVALLSATAAATGWA